MGAATGGAADMGLGRQISGPRAGRPRAKKGLRGGLRSISLGGALDFATLARPRLPFQVFLELFVHSSVWMAFSLASLVPFAQLSLTAPQLAAQAAPLASPGALASAAQLLDARPFWTGALQSLAVYTLDHLRDLNKQVDGKASGVLKFRKALLQVLCASSLAGLCGCLLAARSGRVVLCFLGHLALCAGYAKMKPKMPYLKAAYVSLLVTFLAVAAPAAYLPGLLTTVGMAGALRLCMLIFCVAFTVEHLQDLRDVADDRVAGVVTLPSGLGPRRAGQVLLGIQAAAALAHVALGAVARLPLRPDMLAVYGVCAIMSRIFGERTPRSLFQVVLEPLYATPLAALVLGACMGSPL